MVCLKFFWMFFYKNRFKNRRGVKSDEVILNNSVDFYPVFNHPIVA